MKCTYSVTYADFVAGQRLHARRKPRVKWSMLILLRIMPVLGIIAGILIFGNFAPSSNFIVIPLLACIGVGAWGFFTALSRPYAMRRLYKQMNNGRPEGTLSELELSEGTLILRLPGISEARFLPAAICYYVEDEKVALLYVARKRFLPIPKRAMDEAGWQALREWIASREAGTISC